MLSVKQRAKNPSGSHPESKSDVTVRIIKYAHTRTFENFEMSKVSFEPGTFGLIIF